jgi:hypothetical protein
VGSILVNSGYVFEAFGACFFSTFTKSKLNFRPVRKLLLQEENKIIKTKEYNKLLN